MAVAAVSGVATVSARATSLALTEAAGKEGRSEACVGEAVAEAAADSNEDGSSSRAEEPQQVPESVRHCKCDS